MPSASERIATVVTKGDLKSVRKASLSCLIYGPRWCAAIVGMAGLSFDSTEAERVCCGNGRTAGRSARASSGREFPNEFDHGLHVGGEYRESDREGEQHRQQRHAGAQRAADEQRVGQARMPAARAGEGWGVQE